MFSRGIALSSIIALATVAQGGVQVQLVPTPSLPQYPPNSVVQVDVKLSQTAGGSDQLLRLVEFDMQNTSSLLTVTLPKTHTLGTPGEGDDIYFWSFSSLSACVSQASFCGFNHYIDDDRPAGTVDTRANILSIAFFGLTADTQAQILLSASGTPVTVGKLEVTMPPIAGTYTLNMMSPSDAGLDRGARVDFGFLTHIIWRDRAIPPDAVAQVTGGSRTFTVCSSDPCEQTGSCCVSGNCSVTTQLNCPGDWTQGGTCSPNPCPPTCVNLVSSVPAFIAFGQYTPPAFPTNSTLWRNSRHVIRLTFDGALPVTTPTAAQLDIREMLPSGAFGDTNLSASFTFTIEGNTLRIREPSATTTVLAHRKWYAIRNLGGPGGWTGVCNFEAQFLVQVGDASGDRFVTATDVGQVNAAPVGAHPDQSRFDINGDGFKTATDVGITNASISGLVVKPTGH